MTDAPADPPNMFRRLWRAATRLDRLLTPKLHDLEVTFPLIGIVGLPPAWDGLRIAHLTDLHAGRFVPTDYLRAVVDVVNANRPDLIVLTGDHVSGRALVRPELTDALARLRAPLGAFAVLGNHDYHVDLQRLRAGLTAAGIHLLINGRALLQRRGQALCLVGPDDLWHHPQPLGRLLAGVPHSVPRILLCHNPDYAEMMPPAPHVELVLAGHTHGGQIKLPLLPPARVPVHHRKYTAGLVAGPRCPVYVSRGIGMVGLPLRWGCPPELPIITLRCA